MRTSLAVMLVLLAGLIAVSLAAGEWRGGAEEGSGSHAPRMAPVAVIAHRVEALRGLRFARVPIAERVTAEQARREGLRELDREYPPARRRADEEVLKLLRLIEPDVDLRQVTASIFGENVAGYYDPRSGRLRTVAGAATGTRVLGEIVLAHELDHALEDQRFRLRLGELSGSDDAGLAYLALVEGSATTLMLRYAQRHFSREETLAGLLGSAFAGTGSLPAFLEAQLVFPYLGGQAFVEDLLRRGGGSWKLVDTSYRFRAPASTEQILHPGAYLRVDQPRHVRLRVGRVLREGWTRTVAGTWGELQTRELLASVGGGGSADAAAGWGGDRYELWQATGGAPAAGCRAPCASSDVLVMRWRWDTPRDEREFACKLRALAGERLKGAVATAERRGTVTLALAPSVALARRVARGR